MRILLVDDEPELVFTLAERLELRGNEVAAVTDGEQALALLAGKPFEVVVVDVKMPGMNGYQLLEKIQGSYPGLPVILLTGHGGGQEEGEADAPQSACAYLYKPVKLEELVATMKACVGEATDD